MFELTNWQYRLLILDFHPRCVGAAFQHRGCPPCPDRRANQLHRKISSSQQVPWRSTGDSTPNVHRDRVSGVWFHQEFYILGSQLIDQSLNLTVASVVHIVEPQWNPSVEEQAVARALRMGQTKEVKIFRYVMKSTVEEVWITWHLPRPGLILARTSLAFKRRRKS